MIDEQTKAFKEYEEYFIKNGSDRFRCVFCGKSFEGCKCSTIKNNTPQTSSRDVKGSSGELNPAELSLSKRKKRK